jgi:hypothetical protein
LLQERKALILLAIYLSYESCEGSKELNGKDASFRNAPMISEPGIIIKQRIRGALVPMPREPQ